MFDPANKVHRNRLFKEIDDATLKQRHFRDDVVEDLRRYAGHIYSKVYGYEEYGASERSGSKEILVNMMFMSADIATQALVAQNPQALLTTEHEELLPFAYRFQRAVNNLAKEINLKVTLRESVLDAYFSMGMVKVYNADGGKVLSHQDIDIDPGRPFAERLSRDDYVYQMATSWSKVGWVQHTYSITREGLKDSRFDQKIARKLVPSSYKGDSAYESERADEITAPKEESASAYRDMFRLKEVFLPFDGMQVVTWGEGQDTPLAVHQYDGPERGPYHRLSFSDMPDNIEPVAPAKNQRELHDLINSLARKLSQQARRSKSIPFYTPAGQEDANRIQKASDGIWTKVNHKDEVGVLTMEGLDQQNWAYMNSMQDQFNTVAGNPNARAGLSPAASTLGQEKIIQDNIGELEAKRQGRVAEWTEGIMSHLGRHLWHDGFKSIPAMYESGGETHDVSWTPEHREGDFLQYNFTVEPFSMEYKSPSQRAAELDANMMQIVMPMMPYIQAQGGTFDIQEYLTIKAELQNQPRLNRVIKWGAPPEMERPGPQEQRQSPVTERHNVRHNEGNPQGEAYQQQQQMMASAERPAGVA